MLSFPAIFKRKKPAVQFMTLDIGSDFVKCLVFEQTLESESTKLKIIGKGKQALGPLYTRGGGIVDYEGVRHAASIAVSAALSESGSKTKDVIIGLSGEMTKGLVTTVRLTRSNPEVQVTDEELASLITKIEDSAFMEASKEIAEMTGNPDLDISLTNSSISAVKVNDNYVKDPVGLACERMEVGLFTAFSPTFHLDLIQKIAASLKLNILTVTSEMFTLSKYLCSGSDNSNMILIDIGGESTDVGVLFGGSLVATRTLSIGGRHVTRAISELFEIPMEEAEEKKIRYSLGGLSQEEAAEVGNSIREVIDIWISGIGVLFSDFEGVKTFPSQILLVGGGSSLKDLVEAMHKEPWTRNIPFKEPPTFARVSLQSLPGIEDATGKASGNDDVMPAAISEIFLEMHDL